MKIGVLIYSLAGGGAERVVSIFVHYLKEKNLDFVLFLMNDTISYNLPDDIQVVYLEKSNSHESGIIKLLKIPVLGYKYVGLLKKHNITHSLSFMTRPNFVNVIAKVLNRQKVACVISERCQPSLQYGYANLKSKINSYLIKTLYPKADKIISNSIGNKNDLIENFGINQNKIKVVYNPIDTDKINEEQPIRNFFDSQFFNFITVGRLDQGKNHELIIRAIENVADSRLYILGDGELKGYLADLILQLKLENRVFLLGHKNPFPYLKSADAFVFASNHEGFPNVLLEAMACGLPILSTDCLSGPREILNGEGYDFNEGFIHTNLGYLVRTNDQKNMSMVMKKMIQDKKINELNKGFAKKLELHSIENIMSAYLNEITLL